MAKAFRKPSAWAPFESVGFLGAEPSTRKSNPRYRLSALHRNRHGYRAVSLLWRLTRLGEAARHSGLAAHNHDEILQTESQLLVGILSHRPLFQSVYTGVDPMGRRWIGWDRHRYDRRQLLGLRGCGPTRWQYDAGSLVESYRRSRPPPLRRALHLLARPRPGPAAVLALPPRSYDQQFIPT